MLPFRFGGRPFTGFLPSFSPLPARSVSLAWLATLLFRFSSSSSSSFQIFSIGAGYRLLHSTFYRAAHSLYPSHTRETFFENRFFFTSNDYFWLLLWPARRTKANETVKECAWPLSQRTLSLERRSRPASARCCQELRPFRHSTESLRAHWPRNSSLRFVPLLFCACFFFVCFSCYRSVCWFCLWSAKKRSKSYGHKERPGAEIDFLFFFLFGCCSSSSDERERERERERSGPGNVICRCGSNSALNLLFFSFFFFAFWVCFFVEVSSIHLVGVAPGRIGARTWPNRSSRGIEGNRTFLLSFVFFFVFFLLLLLLVLLVPAGGGRGPGSAAGWPLTTVIRPLTRHSVASKMLIRLSLKLQVPLRPPSGVQVRDINSGRTRHHTTHTHTHNATSPSDRPNNNNNNNNIDDDDGDRNARPDGRVTSPDRRKKNKTTASANRQIR